MVLNWQKFFQFKYLFSSHLSSFSPLFQYSLLIFLGFFLALGLFFFILSWLKKKKKSYYLKPFRKLYTYFLTLGLIGFLLFFFRQEKVYLFNLRFWWLIWFAVGIIWLFFIIRYLILDFPIEKKEKLKLEVFKRYLPAKKSNRKK